MKIASIIATLSITAFAWGCGSETQMTPKSIAVNSSPQRPNPPVTMPKFADKGNSGLVSISDEVKRACGISDDEAYFEFDSAAVRERDRTILDKLRTCFTSGPLKGRTMQLVGHADPRGDDNYNLALGGKRADSVKQVIVGRGMPAEKVVTTSRGEMDATGTDESTWAKDRRVDVRAGS